jgi:hypothetical protein
MNDDPEIEAMRKISETLCELDEESVQRVLRFGSIALPDSRGIAEQEDANDQDIDLTLGELFARMAPKTESEKVLVMSYALKTLEGFEEVSALQVNKELTHLGHHIQNITRAFDGLKATKPQLMIQTRKSGTSKQARKTYKLTSAGIQRVQEMQSNPES